VRRNLTLSSAARIDLMSPNPAPEPTQTFEFEPEEARKLNWLPLAVRYKLDQCGLRVSLRPWQTLAHAHRQRLVESPAGDGFASLAIALLGTACRREHVPRDPGRFREYLALSESKRSANSS
jgi:hypothetical protein